MPSIPHDVDRLIEESLSCERSGNMGQTFRSARQALEKAQADGGAEAISAALACEAYLQFRTSNFDQARSLAEEVLSLAAAGSPAYVDALLVLGICACETDNLDEGEEYYRQAISISRQLGDRRCLFRGLHNLSAGVYMSHDQFDLSIASAEEAIRIASIPELQGWIWLPLCIIARIYWIIANHSRARENMAKLSLVARRGSPPLTLLPCCWKITSRVPPGGLTASSGLQRPQT